MELINQADELVQQLIIEGGPMADNKKIVVQKLQLNKIKLGKNSRLSHSKEELDGLMQSIKETGLLQPIGVVKKNGGYEVCYGNRRFMAVSKLGYSHIPAIVHESKTESDVDMKNLTENVQRRNISLPEVGRYIELLKAEGLSMMEISVRLGVSKGYVENCLEAYRNVPVQFRKDLDVNPQGNVRGKKSRANAGKIPIKAAKMIINAKRTFRLQDDDVTKLFQAAKSADDFVADDIPKYAAAIKDGKKDFIKSVDKVKYLNLKLMISESEYNRLYSKHVVNGQFRSLTGLIIAVLGGKKSEIIKDVRGSTGSRKSST